MEISFSSFFYSTGSKTSIILLKSAALVTELINKKRNAYILVGITPLNRTSKVFLNDKHNTRCHKPMTLSQKEIYLTNFLGFV